VQFRPDLQCLAQGCDGAGIPALAQRFEILALFPQLRRQRLSDPVLDDPH
jgi:hypothetical protein